MTSQSVRQERNAAFRGAGRCVRTMHPQSNKKHHRKEFPDLPEFPDRKTGATCGLFLAAVIRPNQRIAGPNCMFEDIGRAEAAPPREKRRSRRRHKHRAPPSRAPQNNNQIFTSKSSKRTWRLWTSAYASFHRRAVAQHAVSDNLACQFSAVQRGATLAIRNS